MPVLLAKYKDKKRSEPMPLDDFFDSDNFVPDELIGLLKGDK